MGGAQLRVGLVRLDDVVFHPHNVRRDLGDLRQLTDSIRRVGLLQPIVVEIHDGFLRLRAGHRRTAACRLAGLKRVPAVIHEESLEDEEWLIASIHENYQRRDLDVDERRRAVLALRGHGCTWQGIGDAFGVAAGTVRAWVNTTPDVLPREEDKQQLAAAVEAADAEGLSATLVASRLGVSTRTVVRYRTGTRPTSRLRPSQLRRFVEAWRRVEDATAAQVLDALAAAIESGGVVQHLPELPVVDHDQAS